MKFDMIEVLKAIMEILADIFRLSDEGILEFVFSKGSELIDQNKDKVNDGEPIIFEIK